jgi:Transposase
MQDQTTAVPCVPPDAEPGSPSTIIIVAVTAGALLEECRASTAPEVPGMARTLRRWSNQVLAWHTTGASNGPTEGLNSLIKKMKRIAAGYRELRPLPAPRPPPCRRLQLGATRHLTPLIREAPVVALKVGGSSPLGHPRSEPCGSERTASRVPSGQHRATSPARSGFSPHAQVSATRWRVTRNAPPDDCPAPPHRDALSDLPGRSRCQVWNWR